MRKRKTLFDGLQTTGEPETHPKNPDPPPTDFDAFLVWLNNFLATHPDCPKPNALDSETTESKDFILGQKQNLYPPKQRPSFSDWMDSDEIGQKVSKILFAWVEEYRESNRRRYEPFGRIPEKETRVAMLDNFKKLYYADDTEPADQVIQPEPMRDRHTYIIGKSGSGKTTLMRNMIYQDLKAGNGLGVIAPEQEMLTEEIMPFIPDDRIADVIYFNPADENPVPFNPLNLEPDEDPDLKADEVMTIFKRIIGSEGTPRIDEILRQSFYALITIPHTTLLDIPKLLNRDDPDYRHQVISQLQDDYCASFWRDVFPQFDKSAHLPILYRVGAFIRDKRVRKTLCQTGQSFNFRQAMDTGKIVLFNLSDGLLGEQNSQLLGQLIVAQFQLAVSSRANIPQEQRRQFYLYIDEFQTFTNTATSSYEKILSRARKYRLALILAHQQTGQIPSDLLRDIFGNVSTMVSFNVSHADAVKLSKELLTQQDGQLKPTPPEKFVELLVGETYCKLGRETFKMKVPLPSEKPDFARVQQIIDHSRNLYATTPATTTSPPTPEPPPVKPEEPEPSTTPKIKPTGRIK